MTASKLDLTPSKYDFVEFPMEPGAVPGRTKLVGGIVSRNDPRV